MLYKRDKKNKKDNSRYKIQLFKFNYCDSNNWIFDTKFYLVFSVIYRNQSVCEKRSCPLNLSEPDGCGLKPSGSDKF